jgi:peptidyl-tRNA hydrolase, PTH2 family
MTETHKPDDLAQRRDETDRVLADHIAGDTLLNLGAQVSPEIADALRVLRVVAERGLEQVVQPASERRLVVTVNGDVKMTRGKYAAQAVHAALMALGVHPGCPVVVLGGKARDIAAMPIQVRDAGRTEVEPGTLTAGAKWDLEKSEPAGSVSP